MLVVGGVLAEPGYRYLGLRLVSTSWFDLDRIWALSLILVGTLSFLLNCSMEGSGGRWPS
ncbi:hypothetical protein WJ47_28010 [Burkholderia ubonensis]|uniref:Uncharacterized protein n=1 Tax=Burkholderia ubonensis TaxID=101571 RepID=A0AB73FWS1_9BURK|nr:hypothetical protein WJ44_03335 [Burkholderia ubonensis]KVL78936.1 hypothetical protein WJ47_28010 [Burkholderia ubonensis]KVM24760.1 hypothetical protein WJ53_14600 [Burkholderia ubonensis]KVM37239.1 hypothetical protein WJ54_33550 [Burkholderia ubonensis]